MTPEKFKQYADAGYNHIPIAQEVLADLDTPLSAYLKLADGAYSYLFESVHGGEQWGRYSIIGLPCQTIIKIFGNTINIEQSGELQESFEHEQPLVWIESYKDRFKVPEIENLPRFNGGLVGYFGYETIGYVEPRLKKSAKPDVIGSPDILLMVSEEMLVFDNLSGKMLLLTHANPEDTDAYEQAITRLNKLAEQLRDSKIKHTQKTPKQVHETDFISDFTEEGFKNAVLKAKDYIVEGDIMQVVLSQRLSIPFQAEPLDLYRSLRCLNPSPYM